MQVQKYMFFYVASMYFIHIADKICVGSCSGILTPRAAEANDLAPARSFLTVTLAGRQGNTTGTGKYPNYTDTLKLGV
ncbi:MAG: hypothetical protein ABFD08_13675 [Syntrophomonas sp.]